MHGKALEDGKWELNAVIDAQLVQTFQKREAYWTDGARKQLEAYEADKEWHGVRISAWVQNYGIHRTKKGPANWNETMLSRMQKDMEPGWNRVEKAVPRILSNIFETVRVRLDNLEKILQRTLLLQSR